jgi:hypothetical protein
MSHLDRNAFINKTQKLGLPIHKDLLIIASKRMMSLKNVLTPKSKPLQLIQKKLKNVSGHHLK